jgi:lipid-binding SYLF domain-containing protein
MRQHVFVAAAALAFAGCATKPATVSDRDRLEQQADSTLGEMRAKDARIDQVLHGAYAYAVFPDVGKAGIGGAGGAFGRGILFEKGVPTGYVKVEQASLGATLGGQKYAELLILRDERQVDQLKQGEFDLGANVSAVIVKKGAALSSDTLQGATVFVMPRGGAMVEAAISGQRIEFVPAG